MPVGWLGLHYRSRGSSPPTSRLEYYRVFCFFPSPLQGPLSLLKPWVCLEKPLHPPTHPSFLEIAVVG